ncbi:S26 family signal peptidase [Clostridioides mangenotii]|uniref:S26 family signal peptidase n=1 Tax=Metaclostridioides mangenotii TaxID=1540 RepID=UPI001C0FDE88|nr:S26 family signal peptidase [Clostridioides mangenotii]MBU5307364.1 hypothetical protein [Clostridioides mangenotii]MCR1955593.1 S26 family signal peptidase [Clostridioides mangenotii]
MKNIRKVFDSTKSLIFPALILLLLIFVIQPVNISGQSIYPKLKNKNYIVIDKFIEVYSFENIDLFN